MRIHEVIAEGPTNITPAKDPYAEPGRPGGKNTPKKPAPVAGQRSYHNYMQRGPALNRPSMTSKQYGKGNVGLT
jgi:hypothetical protein